MTNVLMLHGKKEFAYMIFFSCALGEFLFIYYKSLYVLFDDIICLPLRKNSKDNLSNFLDCYQKYLSKTNSRSPKEQTLQINGKPLNSEYCGYVI